MIKFLLVMALLNGEGNVEQAVVHSGYETKAECNQVLLSRRAGDLPAGYYVKVECVDTTEWMIIKPQETEKLNIVPSTNTTEAESN